MDIKKVKVFDAYEASFNNKSLDYYKSLGLSSSDLFDYHNQILGKNGLVKPCSRAKWRNLNPIKPLEEDLVEKDKYELDNLEKMTLKMLKDSTKQAKDLYDSCKRKQHKFEDMLIQNIDIDKDIYNGDKWDCNFSPLGYCLYSYDESGEPCCIFCGEPEERK